MGAAPLAREIGQVYPKRLARDGVGRIVGKEVHAGNQHVLGDDEVVARRLGRDRGVVAQPEPARTSERREVARDEVVFGGAGHRQPISER